MNIITPWLRTYVPNIPADDYQLADDLTLRGIAVEGVHALGPGADGRSNDHLFEMDITTNRVDAMNHYGIAREVATTVCFLDGGRILEQGPPSKLLVAPEEERTRQFLKRVLPRTG